MANESSGKVINFIRSNYVSVAAVLVVFLMFIPVPKIIIDLCMILNLAFALIILLVVLNTPRASDFQTFPRIILFQTLFGLAINISSTRLILLRGADIDTQSTMVRAFADIVAGNNLVIGFVIFIILIIVQVVVITKGAGRVSEVAARFSLDSMSQKFFDVDNRLNSGIIDDAEAMRQKDAIRKEIDFYSNMDGSSKFVSGNVKAGIFITVVNLVGGILIGWLRDGQDISSALQTFSLLTIGDGLMSQLPSLIISFATGILVTGTKSDDSLANQLVTDFAQSGYVYEIVGAVLVVIGIALRQGTQFLLVPVGILFIFIGFRMVGNKEKEKKAKESKAAEDKAIKQTAQNSADDQQIEMLDDLSLELGYGLIPLVSKEKGAELLERITRIRNEAKNDMGFVIPKIHIRDDMTLDPNDYSFKIKGIEEGRANIKLGFIMCIDTGAVINPLQGERTKDPTFGMNAIWLPEEQKGEAEAAGYVVADSPTIIATHLTEIIRANASKLLGRQEVASIMNTVKEKNPVLVDEVLNTAGISYGIIQKVLQNLLKENVSIRNIVTILETLANFAGISKDPYILTEKVREALGLQICTHYADPDDKRLRVMRLDESLAQLIYDHAYFPTDGSAPSVALDPPDRRKWLQSVSASLAAVQKLNYQPIIMCASQVRRLVLSSIEREMPGVVVISETEIMVAGRNIGVEVISDITFENE